MAFEAFLTQHQAQPKTRRRITYVVSLVVHGILLVIGVVYSFWHVEELSPPTVRVTFMAAAPPPPPPPPPAAAGGAPKKTPVKPKITPTPTLVQPKPGALTQPIEKKKVEEKKVEDDDDEPPGGIVGGKKGGVIGGVVGGTVGGTIGGTPGGVIGGTVGGEPQAPEPRMLPPARGAGQRFPGEPEPDFPAMLRKPGVEYVAMAKICVNARGTVDSVTLIRKANPVLDNNVVTTVKKWRYRPQMANNTPVPFCYVAQFEFKSD